MRSRKKRIAPNERRKFFRTISKPFVLAARAAKKEATTLKPLRGARAISRRQAIGRMGIGAGLTYGALRGAKYFARQIPFWLGAKKRYSLLMNFGPHSTINEAKSIIDEVKRAKKAGTPYHVCFIEAADATDANFAKKIKNYTQGAEKIPPFYKKLRRQGVSDEEARLRIMRTIMKKNPILTPFGASQLVNLSIEGVRVVPIERHTVRNAARINSLYEKINKQQDKLDAQRKNGTSLLQQQNTINRMLGFFNQMAPIRDPVFEDVVKRFKDAEGFFPELKKLPQIRAIGHLGSAHRTLYFSFNHSDPRIQLEEIQPTFGEKLVTDFQLRSLPGKFPGGKEERIGVIAGYLDVQIEKLRQLGRMDYVREIFRKVPALSQREFEELSRLTQGIRDENKRAIFILNHLFGKELFK